jgi:Spy/CpxP family protein refolding chaperone
MILVSAPRMMKVGNTPKLLLGFATLLFAVALPVHAGDDATMPRWLKRHPVANPLGIDPMLLLQTDNIKAELKLTTEQSEQIAKLATEYSQKLSEQAGDTRLSTLSDEERAKKEKELRQAAEEIMQAERADVEKILTAEQLDSFKRIMLRLSGSDA